jgi:hypothetical protein
VLLGFLVGFLPTILSTNWGKDRLEKWINDKISGTIEIRKMDLHWGKGQKIDGFILRDPEGQSVMGFEKLYTDATIWQILNKGTDLGFTRVKDFNAAIVTDQNGQSNLQKALGLDPIAQSTLPPSTISLSDVQGDFYLTKDPNIPFTGHLKGTTREGNLIGSFEIDVVLNGLDGSDWSSWKEDANKILSIEGGKNAKIHAKIVNFPINLIDQFMILKGVKQAYFRPLLGEKIDIYLDKDPDPTGLTFNLNLLAPHLQGHIKGILDSQVFTIHEPAIFNFDLIPEAINNFTNEKFSLVDPSRLELTIQEIQIPLTFFSQSETVDNCKYHFNVQANLSPTSVNFSNARQLMINDFNLSFIAPACKETIEVQIIGRAEEKEKPFEIQLESFLSKPKNANAFIDQLKQNMKAFLKISHLPINLLYQSNKSILDQVGPYVDLQLDLQHIKNDQFEGSLAFQSDNLQLEKTNLRLEDHLTLSAPALLKLNIQPNLFSGFLDSKDGLLNQTYPVQLKINQLIIPLHFPEKSKIAFDVLAPNLVLPNLTTLGELNLKNLKITGESKDQSLWQFAMSFDSELMQSDNKPSSIFYSPINWTAFSLIKVNPNGKFEIPSLRLKVEGAAGGAELDGQLNSDYIFTQNKPLIMYYRLTPKAFKELSKNLNFNNIPQLQSTSFFEFSLEPSPVDFKNDWLSKLFLKGSAHIDQMTLKDKTNLAISMEKISIPIVVDARHNILDVVLQGTAFTSLDPKPNPFSMTLKVEQWLFDNKLDFNHTKTEFSSHLIALPTALISRFFTDKDLTPLLGKSLDVELKTLIDREKHNSGYWDMTMDGTSLHARTRLFLDDSITLYVSKNPTAIVRWTVTPAGYDYLQKTLFNNPTPLTLSEPFVMTTHLSSLNFPFKFESSSFEEGQITAHIATTNLNWKEFPSLAPFKWEGKIESEKLSQLVNFELSTKTSDTVPLSLKGTLSDIFDEHKNINAFEQMHVKLDFKANQLPAEFFQAASLLDLTQMDKFKALWGDKIDAYGIASIKNLTGPLHAEITGTNGRAYLKGELTNGILKLNEPFTWSIRVTPLLGNILAKNAPFLGTMISADNPIQLTIEPKGFSCPVYPFDLNKISLEKGTINAGKVNFLNQGDLNQILSFITPVSGNQMTIWFTPIFFQLHSGELQMKRFDMLVASLYTLACWGKMDLKSHDFDLVLGLTPQSLNQAFAIEGLNEDYIFQVPISGRKGRVEIDKTKIIGRISALVAQMKGGNKGKILGSILEMAVSDKRETIPPEPTTSPFPWSKEWQHTPKKSSRILEQVNAKEDESLKNEPKKKSDREKSDKKKNKTKDKVDSFLQLLDKI